MWDAIRDQAGTLQDRYWQWWMSIAVPGIALGLRQFRFLIASPFLALKLTEDLKTSEKSNERLRSHNTELELANQKLREEIAQLRIDLAVLADSHSGSLASIQSRNPVPSLKPNASSPDSDT